MMPAAVVGGRLLGVTRGAAPLPPRLHFETVLEAETALSLAGE